MHDATAIATMEVMETTLEQSSILTAHDRCDRCGAQAYVKYALVAGGELLFCAHHARANEGALESVARRVIDETNKLVASSHETAQDS